MTIRVIADNTCSGFSAPWLLSVRLPIGMGDFHSSLLLHLTGAVKLSPQPLLVPHPLPARVVDAAQLNVSPIIENMMTKQL